MNTVVHRTAQRIDRSNNFSLAANSAAAALAQLQLLSLVGRPAWPALIKINHGFTMITMVIPWFNHGFTMVTMVLPSLALFYHQLQQKFLSNHGQTMVLPWLHHGFHGFTMVIIV